MGRKRGDGRCLTERVKEERKRKDVWGAIFKAQQAGIAARHELERDDGRIEVFESAANYFNAPRNEAERELLESITGPVLDLACGAGSYTLYLQGKGLAVTAAEFSAGAREVCRTRGCHDVVAMDLRSLQLPLKSYGAIIVMGNTLGAHQHPATLPKFLSTLRGAACDGGHLLFTMIDPLDTSDAGHLIYQQKNREKGLPPGLIRMRVKYSGLTDDWMTLWMLTEHELMPLMWAAGWTAQNTRSVGPWRIRLFTAA